MRNNNIIRDLIEKNRNNKTPIFVTPQNSNEANTDGTTYYGNTNFGEYQYDKQTRADLITSDKLEQFRGERQGWGAELGNAVIGGLAKIPFSVIGNTASALDFGDYYNTDKEVGNAITAWAEEVKGNIEDATKIYKSNDDTLGSREWWMNNGKGLIDSAGGFIITGAGLGAGISKGAQFLNGLAKGSKVAAQIIDGAGAVANATMLNQAESIPIAMNVYKSTLELTGDEQKAADAAAYSIAINRINIPLNLTSAGAFLRTPELTRQIATNFSKKEVLGKLLAEGSQEYLEEDINMIAEKEALLKAKQGNNYTYNFDRTIGDILSKEGFENGIVGFIGGIAQTGGTELIQSFQKDSPSYDIDGNVRTDDQGNFVKVTPQQSKKERFKAQQKSLNTIELLSKTEGTNTIKETLDNIRTNATLLNDIQEAAVVNDNTKVKELQNKLLVNQSLDAFKNGTTDQLINMYKSLSNDPQAEEKFGKEHKTKSVEAIKQIEDLEKIYIKHQGLPQINEAFNNRAEFSYTLNAATELQREITKTEVDQHREIEVTGFRTPKQVESLTSTKELKVLQDKMKNLSNKTIKLEEDYNFILSDDFKKQKLTEKETQPIAKEEAINKEFNVSEQDIADEKQSKVVETPVETTETKEQPFSLSNLEGVDINASEEFDGDVIDLSNNPVSNNNNVVAPKTNTNVSKTTSNNPREIYPGLNNASKRGVNSPENPYGLPTGDQVRKIVKDIENKGINVNTRIFIQPTRNTRGDVFGLIKIQPIDGDWINIGNIQAFDQNDALMTYVNTQIKSKIGSNSGFNPSALGIKFNLTNGVLDIISPESNDALPNLTELLPNYPLNNTGDQVLIFDTHLNSWTTSIDESLITIEGAAGIKNIESVNKANEKIGRRYLLVTPVDNNTIEYIGLRADLQSEQDLTTLVNSLKDLSKTVLSNKELTADDMSAANNAITKDLFIALNPSMKIDGDTQKSMSLEPTVTFGKNGAGKGAIKFELSYKAKSGAFRNKTIFIETKDIENINNINDLIELVNNKFKKEHEIVLNLKPNDFQKSISNNDVSEFRASVKPNIFTGSQIVFNEVANTEQTPVQQITNEIVSVNDQLIPIAESNEQSEISETNEILYSTNVINDALKSLGFDLTVDKAINKSNLEQSLIDLSKQLGLTGRTSSKFKNALRDKLDPIDRSNDDIALSLGEEISTGIPTTEIDHIKALLPSSISIQNLSTLIKNLKVKGIPYGAFRKSIVYLNEQQGKPGTAYHEAFHAVFRTLLSEQDINKYLNAAKNEYKGDLKKDIEDLILGNPDNVFLSKNQLEQLVYEEYMADRFAKYSLDKSTKSTGSTLKQLFAKIKNFFNSLFKNTNELDILFDNILKGSFVNTSPVSNRFDNTNSTVFKLLPKDFSKSQGTSYFTATKSRILINTFTAKLHNAKMGKYSDQLDLYDKGVLKSDEELLDVFFDQRINELNASFDENGYIDTLTKENPKLAEQVSLEIENELFLLDEESMRGEAIGLLRDEVLNRLELFNYVSSNIDHSEDLENGDDVTLENNSTDDNEIKETFGSKDAWLTGGHDSLSKTIKQYIAFTTYQAIDPLTGKYSEFGIDEVTLYNGLTRVLADTREENMFNKLAVVAESNPNIDAFLKRITDELNMTIDSTNGKYTSNVNSDLYNTLRLFLSNFKKSKVTQLMTTVTINGNIADYQTFNANPNDAKKISIAEWENALNIIESRTKATKRELSSNVTLIENIFNTGLKSEITNEELNKRSKDIQKLFKNIGISLSPSYIKYSLLQYKIQNDVKLNDYQQNIVNQFTVTPITMEFLKGNGQDFGGLKGLLNKGVNIFDSNEGMSTRLADIAEGNSYFDESIGNSSFTNAEGNKVYEIINMSYVLDKINDIKSEVWQDTILNKTAKGLTEVESKNFKFIENNYLLNKHKDALKALKLNITNGFRNTEDSNGVTFGSYDERTYFATALSYFATSKYIFRQNEASNTAYVVDLPVISTITNKGTLTTNVTNIIYDRFLNEFNRINREYLDKDNTDKIVYKGYNDSLEQGSAYRFSEFSYIALTNPKLYNELLIQAKEGIINNTNEKAVKQAINNYLNQGFDRFKKQLNDTGFLNSANHYVPDSLIKKYGTVDNALREFYNNDYIMSASFNDLLDGDYALSRNDKGVVKTEIMGTQVMLPKVPLAIDIVKRNKGGMASGPDYGRGTHKVAYIKDINKYIVTKVNSEGNLTRVDLVDGKFIGTDGKEYTKDDVSKITTNDAQSYSSQYHHIFGSLRLGRIDSRAAEIYKGLIQFTKRDSNGNIVRNINIAESDQEYLEKSLASGNSKKTITFDGIAGIYHKLSEFGLFRSAISYIEDQDVDTFTELTNNVFDLLVSDKTDTQEFKDLVKDIANIYKPVPGMKYLHNLANKMDIANVDQVVTESASKGTTIKPVDSLSADYDLENASTLVRNASKRMQTETPTGKDVITAGSQLINLIDSELKDSYNVLLNGKETTLGQVRSEYRKLMSDARQTSFKQAQTYLKLLEDGTIDKTKLDAKLVRALEANNNDEVLIELFDRGYNFNMSNMIEKAEQIVLAHFSKGVLNQKVNGTKVSLVSDAGIQVVRDNEGNIIPYHEVVRNPSKYIGYNTSTLKYNVKDKDGKIFSESLLSERILTKHGLKLGDTISYNDIKNYPELFEAIGYRIPTQGHQSMMAFKVVGLLPNYLEGVGMFPQEIVYLSGADFDIDSEFIQLPQFWIKDDKPVKFGTEKTDDEKWEAFQYYNEHYNKEFKAEYKRLIRSYKDLGKQVNKIRAYVETSESLDLPINKTKFLEYKNTTLAGTNADFNNKSLELMLTMLTSDYVLQNSANNGTTTDPLAEVSNDIQDLKDQDLKPGVITDNYWSASDINGKSIANTKNSAGKSGIGIVANKIQQLTFLIKANGSTGSPLKQNAFKWHIGSTIAKGYFPLTSNNKRVMDYLGILLNVMTDNAKDPIAGNMGLSLELLNGYSELVAQGLDVKTAALLINQPVIQSYGQIKKTPNYTLSSKVEKGLTKSKLVTGALAKLLYGDYSSDSMKKINIPLLENMYLGSETNPKEYNLTVEDLTNIINGTIKPTGQKVDLLNELDTYNRIQVIALLQFNKVEQQSDTISNLNTYLKLNQGLDISISRLRLSIDKSKEQLSNDNKNLHVDIEDTLKKDVLTNNNVKMAERVLKLGEKIFIEQNPIFRNNLDKIKNSLSDSFINTKDAFKNVSRDFLGYISTIAFKQSLKNIINNDTNKEKADNANRILNNIDSKLIYPELGKTLAQELVELQTSNKDYIKDNPLIKYLRPVLKYNPDSTLNATNKKGIDIIDGKSFAKESNETISILLDGFKQLYVNEETRSFAINLFNYMMVKDNLQFKSGSISKYIAPSMFKQYSEVLDGIVKNINSNTIDNSFNTGFELMSYNFRKLYVTYKTNEFKKVLYKSIKEDAGISINGNDITFNSKIEDSNKNISDIFEKVDKTDNYIFPQFHNFNGNVYELKATIDSGTDILTPHNMFEGVSSAMGAVYSKLEFHGNSNVSPFSNETYEEAIRLDSIINNTKESKIINEPDVDYNFDYSQINGNFAEIKLSEKDPFEFTEDFGDIIDYNDEQDNIKC